ncbi:hypothetical protein NECAME_08388 [Necator americanus]|uniref:Uncharacterized protein n=1 Tax=Necator americanus TaxID=51031 RepID=W2TIK8_NECAM|nr:hypothetical protein NECAME_08388 [Necator americanus]ETN81643.1 hypothetical protein NECAME_08388 [Necator americanus]
MIEFDFSVLSFEKKSDMSEFTSAINGASRLRYGKRNFDFAYPLTALRDPTDFEDPYIYDKRAPLTNKLIQSLNGAERLRFGRK